MDEAGSKVDVTKSYDSADIVFAVLYATVILTGIFGNSLVIAVVWKTKSMHTATNYLLVNLAVSDIVVLLWCPKTYNFAVVGSLPQGAMGDYLCKFFVGDAMDTLGLGVTLFTLTTLAIERYQALVKPLNTRYKLTKESVVYVIAVTWIISLAVDIPDFIFTHLDPETGKCASPWSIEMACNKATYVSFAISIFVFLPTLVITFCYFQILRGMFITRTICSGAASENSEKRKLAILIIGVTAAFYISFLPYSAFILHVALLAQFETDHEESETEASVLKVLVFLTVSNCSLNPILYASQSENYRRGFKRLFCRKNAAMEDEASNKVELQPYTASIPQNSVEA